MGGVTKDFGKITTPMAHWFVKYFNEFPHGLNRETFDPQQIIPMHTKHFGGYFTQFMKKIGHKKSDKTIMLDCANGVGGLRIEPFLPIINEFCSV